MKGQVIGILAASVVVYMWGFLYWGLNPLPYSVWKETKDDTAAGAALREHFPERGTYYIPGMYNDQEQLAKMHEAGPIAFVHITSVDGRPMMDPSIMLKGVVLTVAYVTLISILLRMALPALPTYAKRVGFVALAGLCASVAIDIGDHVWWVITLQWKLYQSLYTILAWTIIGLVLAAFMRGQNTFEHRGGDTATG